MLAAKSKSAFTNHWGGDPVLSGLRHMDWPFPS